MGYVGPNFRKDCPKWEQKENALSPAHEETYKCKLNNFLFVFAYLISCFQFHLQRRKARQAFFKCAPLSAKQFRNKMGKSKKSKKSKRTTSSDQTTDRSREKTPETSSQTTDQSAEKTTDRISYEEKRAKSRKTAKSFGRKKSQSRKRSGRMVDPTETGMRASLVVENECETVPGPSSGGVVRRNKGSVKKRSATSVKKGGKTKKTRKN